METLAHTETLSCGVVTLSAELTEILLAAFMNDRTLKDEPEPDERRPDKLCINLLEHLHDTEDAALKKSTTLNRCNDVDCRKPTQLTQLLKCMKRLTLTALPSSSKSKALQ
jgi:hypothetical protein